MRRLLVGLLIAGTLVGGAIAYAIAADSPAATAQEDEAPETTDESAALQDTSTTMPDASTKDDTRAGRSARSDVLGEVLDEAVADGLITQEQADRLRDSFAAKREEIRAEFGSDRGHAGIRGFGRLGADLRGLLVDGVIDADELAALPEGHPLTDPDGPAAELLEDGQITQEELDELLPSLQDGSRFRGGSHDDAESSTTG
jgi:hypothetical protein